ncbi:enoyl-CoA hydratase [Mycobacterium branderi]|uniref:Enoyl-CoA hydratase n=1 Tax=Mycobacterium branderi TaxID=43348 RepID=A0A7I7WFD3_9MYCO|nr:enoyl-CoA hydratase [Mycobacterium branderi]MCV7231849.1 enoyl-CoA hydratase [Mycobacterium branderi]ORA40205.1 enoyl-CoA hydratase [Mycobacterium branderi]BBZ15495.1 enoyl-CoA hydratase [Mycobacterium branderi]
MTTINSDGQAYAGIDDLAVEFCDGVLSITLNRPDTLNALTAAMYATMADTLERAATDPGVRVVRLGGAGRGFSSGAGVSAQDQAARNASGSQAEIVGTASRAIRSIVNLPQPVVAVVQGPAAGIGASLALACDVILASEDAFFVLAFTTVGLMTDGGASALFAAAVGRVRAMRMALLAERISAAEAYAWGLVTALYPADGFNTEVARVISTLAKGPMVALRKTKQAINAATLTELEAALEREQRGQRVLIESNDFREGAKAFQERRPPKFTDY